jgi:hypothetical protein
VNAPVLSTLIAALAALVGSLGTLALQQRSAQRAERRTALHTTGAAFLAALTTYRASVYSLWRAHTDGAPADEVTARTTDVRHARAALTTARDSLLLLAAGTDRITTTVHAAVDAAYHLGDDTEQDHVTTGRPAALAAHNAALAALAHTIRTT